jgi:hypothetical protein
LSPRPPWKPKLQQSAHGVLAKRGVGKHSGRRSSEAAGSQLSFHDPEGIERKQAAFDGSQRQYATGNEVKAANDFVQRVRQVHNVKHIVLSLLDRAAASVLISERFHLTSPIPARVEDIIWLRSSGHPRLAFEVARAMQQLHLFTVENGVMTEDPRLFYFRPEDVKVPNTMTAAAATVIDRLEIRQQLILKVAAAFEDDMSFDDLTDLCIMSDTMPNLNREQTKAMLRVEVPYLIREELLTVTEAGELRFAQKHLQEAAYSLLTFKLRQKLHQELAQLLKGRISRRKLARHYCKSENWLEALSMLESSSEDALRVRGYDEASTGFVELIHLVEANAQASALAPPTRLGHWHIGLAIAQQRLGNIDPAATHFFEAVRLLGGRRSAPSTSVSWLLRRYARALKAHFEAVLCRVPSGKSWMQFRPCIRVLCVVGCKARHAVRCAFVQAAPERVLEVARLVRGCNSVGRTVQFLRRASVCIGGTERGILARCHCREPIRLQSLRVRGGPRQCAHGAERLRSLGPCRPLSCPASSQEGAVASYRALPKRSPICA